MVEFAYQINKLRIRARVELGVAMSRRRINPSARQWETTRRAVFERDGYRCQATGCGKAGRLEAHHVVHLASGWQQRFGQPFDADAGAATSPCTSPRSPHGKETQWERLVSELT